MSTYERLVNSQNFFSPYLTQEDLSRFGRNYLEAGYYIETVFPFLGVRLIAVNDNFDSTRKEDMESMALPIRNMINTMYAKDISKKVWSSLQRKKEAGYAVGSDAPFGYIRNPVTKRNEIDPETAFYVQLIFQWALMGVAIYEIARRMTLLQVPTPREWHRKIVEGKDVVTYKKWGETSIRHMLANQTYAGDTINNKSTQKFLRGRTNVTYRKNSGTWQKIHIQPSLQGMILKRCRIFWRRIRKYSKQ